MTISSRGRDLAQNPPLGVLLGADSLRHRRSGIGRMTLEIARHVCNAPEVGAFALLFENHIQGLDFLDNLPDFTDGGRPADSAAAVPAQPPIHRTVKSYLGRFAAARAARDAKRRWQLKKSLANFSSGLGRGGRVVYHEPNMIARPYDGPTVVTINDLSWHGDRDFHPSERLEWIARYLPNTLRQASRFVAISQFTADGMVAELGLPRDKIDVVRLAPSAHFRPIGAEAARDALARHGLGDRRYILSVSTLEPRKNFERLAAAHARLPTALRKAYPLAIVGGKGWGEVTERFQTAEALREGSLRLLGHVSDADLVALYARSAAFAFVSLYEGFGLPLVEAMACGAPVIASSTTAVGEVTGEAGLTVDPLDESAISEALRRVIEDEKLAEELRQKGLAHAAEYSWDDTVASLITCWRRAAVS